MVIPQPSYKCRLLKGDSLLVTTWTIVLLVKHQMITGGWYNQNQPEEDGRWSLAQRGQQEGCVTWEFTSSPWVYQCTSHSTTKVSLSLLIFSDNIQFLIDDPANTTAIPNTTDKHKKLVAPQIQFISNVIPGIQDERCMQQRSPSNLDREKFHFGDWTWLHETKYYGIELCPVFALRWMSPFQVWEVWNKGAYRLQSDPKYVGKKTMVILRNPVNRNQMKTYMERE